MQIERYPEAIGVPHSAPATMSQSPGWTDIVEVPTTKDTFVPVTNPVIGTATVGVFAVTETVGKLIIALDNNGFPAGPVGPVPLPPLPIGPVGPVTEIPVGPVGPVNDGMFDVPVGPVGPVRDTPTAPVGPVAPVPPTPVAPVGPVPPAPVGPVTPVGPVKDAPVGPVGPANIGPVGPVTPVGPVDPVLPAPVAPVEPWGAESFHVHSPDVAFQYNTLPFTTPVSPLVRFVVCIEFALYMGLFATLAIVVASITVFLIEKDI
jgi:hypothetical protein